MAKKVAGKKAEKVKKDPEPGMLDQPMLDTSIESAFSLVELRLRSVTWTAKILVSAQITEAHQRYVMKLSFDDGPYQRRIEAIREQLASGMFKDDKTEQRNAQKSIENIGREMVKQHESCEDIEMPVTVLELKYLPSGTQLVVMIPDGVVEAVNRQKMRLGKLYKVRLEEVSS